MQRKWHQRPGPNRTKPRERSGKSQATGNRHLGEQIRKILRKHYANKYRVR